MPVTYKEKCIKETRKRRKKIKIFCYITALLLIFVTVIGIVIGIEKCTTLNSANSKDKGGIISKTNDNNVYQPTIQPVNNGATNNNSDPTQNDNDQWALNLVNNSNPLLSGYIPNLQSVGNGFEFDYRAAQSLIDMINAAKAAGLSPFICSAYRSESRQRSLFNDKVEDFRAKGYSDENAQIEAQTVVAYPRSSEHQLGLAVDIVSRNYHILDDKQADTPEAKWLKENCSKFGFILRYPPNKKEITGVIFEPWHYRYVGKVAAEEIMSTGICLEEYLQ